MVGDVAGDRVRDEVADGAAGGGPVSHHATRDGQEGPREEAEPALAARQVVRAPSRRRATRSRRAGRRRDGRDRGCGPAGARSGSRPAPPPTGSATGPWCPSDGERGERVHGVRRAAALDLECRSRRRPGCPRPRARAIARRWWASVIGRPGLCGGLAAGTKSTRSSPSASRASSAIEEVAVVDRVERAAEDADGSGHDRRRRRDGHCTGRRGRRHSRVRHPRSSAGSHSSSVVADPDPVAGADPGLAQRAVDPRPDELALEALGRLLVVEVRLVRQPLDALATHAERAVLALDGVAVAGRLEPMDDDAGGIGRRVEVLDPRQQRADRGPQRLEALAAVGRDRERPSS